MWRQLQHGLALARHAPIEVEDYQRAQDILVHAPRLVAADALHIAVAEGIASAGARVTFMTADERQSEVAVGPLDEVQLSTDARAELHRRSLAGVLGAAPSGVGKGLSRC